MKAISIWEQDDWMDVHQAAKYLRYKNHRTIYNLIYAGKLKAYKRNGNGGVLLLKADLRKMIEEK